MYLVCGSSLLHSKRFVGQVLVLLLVGCIDEFRDPSHSTVGQHLARIPLLVSLVECVSAVKVNTCIGPSSLVQRLSLYCAVAGIACIIVLIRCYSVGFRKLAKFCFHVVISIIQ